MIIKCNKGMRIDHAALFCRDLEQMRQFFIDYFDARSNEQYHNPRTGLRTYILSFTEGSTRLELMQRPDVQDADPSQPTIGYVHLSFAVGRSAQGDACHSKNKELYIIPGAVHTALYDNRAGVIPYDKMEEFFAQYLK